MQYLRLVGKRISANEISANGERCPRALSTNEDGLEQETLVASTSYHRGPGRNRRPRFGACKTLGGGRLSDRAGVAIQRESRGRRARDERRRWFRYQR